MLRQLIVRDFGLKLLSLGLAVAFWIQVAGQPVVERGLDVPLGFENVPDLLEVGGDLPDTVRVRVRGAASIVSGLQPGDVVAAIDLAGERPGRRRLFDMFAGRVRAPFGVDVTQVVPATITVSLEPAGAPRAVTVVPDVEGRPAEGFAVGRITAEPASVEVVGPARRLAGLTEALTEPVSIDGAVDRVRATVTVGAADPMIRLRTPGSRGGDDRDRARAAGADVARGAGASARERSCRRGRAERDQGWRARPAGAGAGARRYGGRSVRRPCGTRSRPLQSARHRGVERGHRRDAHRPVARCRLRTLAPAERRLHRHHFCSADS